MVVLQMLLMEVEVEEQQAKLVRIEMKDVVQEKQVEEVVKAEVVQVVLDKVEQQHQVAHYKEEMEVVKLTAEAEAVDIMAAEAADIQNLHLLWEVEAVAQDILIHLT